MRVLITQIFPPHVGGSGKWFYEVVLRQPQKFVVFCDRLKPGEMKSNDEIDTVHRIDFEIRDTGFFSFCGARSYMRIVRSMAGGYRFSKKDIIVAGRMVPEGWLAMLLSIRFGIPFACFAHGEEINKENCDQGGVMSSRQHRWMGATVARRAKFWIANSLNTASILQKQWSVSRDKISVIHPGVDTNYFCPAPQENAFRDFKGWMDRTVVLTVGRLQERKGHDQLIRALPSIAAKLPNVLYAIVGSGERLDSLVKLVEQLQVQKYVQFLGPIGDDDLLRCYQQCDLFVLPNRSVGSDIEGFGMVLVEASACGKPIIAGRSGGTSETMIEGETGFLVDACDTNSLAATIIKALTETDREKMAAAGRELAVNHFDWEIVPLKIDSAFCRHVGTGF